MFGCAIYSQGSPLLGNLLLDCKFQQTHCFVQTLWNFCKLLRILYSSLEKFYAIFMGTLPLYTTQKPISTACTWNITTLFQYLRTYVRIRTGTYPKTDSFVVVEISCFVIKERKNLTKYCVCFTNPCIKLLVLSSTSWGYPPIRQFIEFLLLLLKIPSTCTAHWLVFLERRNTSFVLC